MEIHLSMSSMCHYKAISQSFIPCETVSRERFINADLM